MAHESRLFTMRRGRLDMCPFSACSESLQFMSCRRYDGKAFHIRGPAAEKLLRPKLLCVRGTTHRSKLRAASVGSELNVEARHDGVCQIKSNQITFTSDNTVHIMKLEKNLKNKYPIIVNTKYKKY